MRSKFSIDRLVGPTVAWMLPDSPKDDHHHGMEMWVSKINDGYLWDGYVGLFLMALISIGHVLSAALMQPIRKNEWDSSSSEAVQSYRPDYIDSSVFFPFILFFIIISLFFSISLYSHLFLFSFIYFSLYFCHCFSFVCLICFPFLMFLYWCVGDGQRQSG